MNAADHATFAAALLDPALPVPAGLRAWNGSDPALRLAVHRNNVMAGLSTALAEAFPVVCALVGQEFFAAMAASYLRDRPPRSPMLSAWGEDFGDWIDAFEPARPVPYLADMARLERARVRLFHAADGDALPPEVIAAGLADPDTLPSARLGWHPAATVFASRWACVSIWGAHQGHARMQQVQPERPEAALISREGDGVVLVPMAMAGATFCSALESGQSLGQALAGMAAEPDFDAGWHLALLIRHGVITAWHNPGDPR